MRDLSPYFLALVVLPIIAVLALAYQGRLDHEARKVARIHAAQAASRVAQVAEAVRKDRQYDALARIDELSPR